MSDGCMSASLRTAATTSSTSSRELRCMCLPKRVIAAPAIKTSLNFLPSPQRGRGEGNPVVDEEAPHRIARFPAGASVAVSHHGLEFVDPGHLSTPAFEPDLLPCRRLAEQVRDKRVGVPLHILAVAAQNLQPPMLISICGTAIPMAADRAQPLPYCGELPNLVDGHACIITPASRTCGQGLAPPPGARDAARPAAASRPHSGL